MKFGLGVILSALYCLASAAQTASPTPMVRSEHKGHLHTLILVDKKTNLLHLAHYEADDSYKILKTYHTTTGKVKGDKEQEGDLKTPEGVYQFSNKILPMARPSLSDKLLHLPGTISPLSSFCILI